MRPGTRLLQKSLPHDFAMPLIDKKARSPMICQGSHHEEGFQAIVGLKVVFSVLREQLKIERCQILTGD